MVPGKGAPVKISEGSECSVDVKVAISQGITSRGEPLLESVGSEGSTSVWHPDAQLLRLDH